MFAIQRRWSTEHRRQWDAANASSSDVFIALNNHYSRLIVDIVFRLIGRGSAILSRPQIVVKCLSWLLRYHRVGITWTCFLIARVDLAIGIVCPIARTM